MFKIFCSSVLVVALALTASVATCITSEPEWVQGSGLTVPTDTSVVHIIVDKIQNDSIYSRDGRKFQIGPNTVVNRHKTSGKISTAVLTFRGSTLVSVSIK